MVAELEKNYTATTFRAKPDSAGVFLTVLEGVVRHMQDDARKQAARALSKRTATQELPGIYLRLRQLRQYPVFFNDKMMSRLEHASRAARRRFWEDRNSRVAAKADGIAVALGKAPADAGVGGTVDVQSSRKLIRGLRKFPQEIAPTEKNHPDKSNVDASLSGVSPESGGDLFSWEAVFSLLERFRGAEVASMDISVSAALDRSELDGVVNGPDFEPRVLLEELKKDDFLKRQYNKSVGVGEGYTLEQHTLMVLGQFERYFKAALPGNVDRGFFRLVLALHDIGKPRAVEDGDKSNQHEHTREIMRTYLTGLHFTPSQIRMAVGLIDGDPIGPYIKGGDLSAYKFEIQVMAKKAGLAPDVFFDLLRIFYMVDAGSYTADAGGKPSLDDLFVFDHSKETADLAPRLAARVKALQDSLMKAPASAVRDRPDVSGEIELPETVDGLARWLMLRQEKLFEALFETTGFKTIQEYEKIFLGYAAQGKVEEKGLRIFKRLKSNDTEVRIHIRRDRLWPVLKEGYKNRAEGGKGSIQSGFSSNQNIVEGDFLDLPPKIMEKLPPETRPHYGMLGPTPPEKFDKERWFEEDLPTGYRDSRRILEELGDFVIILDPKDYKDRLSLTAGDSANTLQDRQRAWNYDEIYFARPSIWDQLFVPWKYRAILLPFFLNDCQEFRPLYLYIPVPFKVFPELARWQVGAQPQGLGPNAEYYECQILGRVDRIKAIEVPKDHGLSAQEIAKIKDMGIEVRVTDWCQWPPERL
ncbi:MAG TPA: hypothetical protein DCP85_06315 [Elusimicrobia bacterium]|nr:hypothetical protein [Elusimicrobiota bacterium]